MANEKFQIEISANSRAFTQSIKEAAKNMKEAFSAAGKDSSKNISKEFETFQKNNYKQAVDLGKKAQKELLQSYKGRWGSENFKVAYGGVTEDLRKAEQALAAMGGGGFPRGRVAGGALAAGAAGTMLTGGATPLMTGAGTAIGSLLGGPGGAVIGAALGAFAGGAVDIFGGAYSNKAGQLLKLRGMGYSKNLGALTELGKRTGYGPDETFNLIESIVSNTGKMGAQGNRLLEGAQKFGRAYGIDSETLSGIFSGVKSSGGGDFEKKTAEIYASAFASKLDKGRLAEYLQVTASKISEFANKTGAVNTGQIASLMGQITAMGKAFTPAMAGAQISNIDAMIRNPGNSLAGALVLKAMGKTLREGGSTNVLRDIQIVQTQGLAGVDLSQYGPETQKKYSSLYGPKGAWSPFRYLRNMADDIKAMGRENIPAGLIGSRTFNGGAVMAESFIEEATKKGGMSDEALQKYVDDLAQTTEKTLADVMNTTQGTTKAVEEFHKWAQLRFGEGIVMGTANKIRSGVSTILDVFSDPYGAGNNIKFKEGRRMAVEYSQVQKNAPEIANFLKSLPFDVTLTDVFRTQKEQDELYRQGKTPAKKSKHTSLQAVDFRMSDLSEEEKAQIRERAAADERLELIEEQGIDDRGNKYDWFHLESRRPMGSIQPNSVKSTQQK